MTVMTETPPPASADWAASVRHGLLALTAGLGVFLLWSTTARLDSAVLAPGVVSVETNRKTVQHLEGGIVREILVHDGDHVEPGQILLRLDQTRAASMRALYSSQLAILLAQEARLAAERDSATSLTFPHDVEEQANNAIVARAIADQRQEFSVKRDTLIRGIETVDAQIAQAQ
ncbi:MAG: biotin/lipoyl-binding protein, partial [Rhizobiales bacterium]|nr:biotin/lipoyl-binding protein [Hyphomicrobiales bacterium]